MNKILYLLLTLVLLSVSASYAQEGLVDSYLVTSQNDTLRGSIKLKGDSLLILKTRGIKESYTVDNTKTVLTEGKKYTVENVVGDKKFLQEIVTGYMSLYRFKNFTTREKFFLKENDSIYVVTENNYPGLINFFLSTCPQGSGLTAKRISRQYKYNLKSMIEFVTNYNSCKGNLNDQVIRYQPEKDRYDIILNTGLDIHQLKINGKNEDYSGASSGNSVGYAMGLSFGLTNKAEFSIRPGIRYTFREGSFTKLPVDINSYTSVDIDFKLRYIEVPVMFRYTFTQKYIRPFISLGPYVGIPLFSQVKRTPYRFSYPDNFEKEANKMGISYGYAGGAGVYFPKILRGLEVQVNAEKSFYEHDYDLEGLQNTSFKVMFGFTLN
jgi:hypothetical protein